MGRARRIYLAFHARERRVLRRRFEDLSRFTDGASVRYLFITERYDTRLGGVYHLRGTLASASINRRVRYRSIAFYIHRGGYLRGMYLSSITHLGR